jgi:mannosyl-3-phosphoglycerate phosphatase
VPLVPTTSKTLAEVADFNSRRLHNPHPCIIENGGALCLPSDYLPQVAAGELCCGYRLHRLGRPYGSILEILGRLRGSRSYRFRGFNDMSREEVANQTALPAPDAARARQRLCSEPILWQDTEAALTRFASDLAEHGLRITRGGRFLHVMDDTDKARAMSRLCELYRQAGFDGFQTVALGDSPNDIEMLSAADIAVIVRRKDGASLDCQGRQRTLHTEAPGPAGWNAAMMQILDDLAAPPAPANETDAGERSPPPAD